MSHADEIEAAIIAENDIHRRNYAELQAEIDRLRKRLGEVTRDYGFALAENDRLRVKLGELDDSPRPSIQ